MTAAVVIVVVPLVVLVEAVAVVVIVVVVALIIVAAVVVLTVLVSRPRHGRIKDVTRRKLYFSNLRESPLTPFLIRLSSADWSLFDKGGLGLVVLRDFVFKFCICTEDSKEMVIGSSGWEIHRLASEQREKTDSSVPRKNRFRRAAC